MYSPLVSTSTSVPPTPVISLLDRHFHSTIAAIGLPPSISELPNHSLMPTISKLTDEKKSSFTANETIVPPVSADTLRTRKAIEEEGCKNNLFALTPYPRLSIVQEQENATQYCLNHSCAMANTDDIPPVFELRATVCLCNQRLNDTNFELQSNNSWVKEIDNDVGEEEVLLTNEEVGKGNKVEIDVDQHIAANK